MAVFLAATAAIVVLLGAMAYACGFAFSDSGELVRERLKARFGRGDREVPTSRPIELVSADLRRLGQRFHSLDPHTSFAKVEAVRGAYDRALGECCELLGVAHLLGVLPTGPELDAERERVEDQLTYCGVRLPHAA